MNPFDDVPKRLKVEQKTAEKQEPNVRASAHLSPGGGRNTEEFLRRNEIIEKELLNAKRLSSCIRKADILQGAMNISFNIDESGLLK